MPYNLLIFKALRLSQGRLTATGTLDDKKIFTAIGLIKIYSLAIIEYTQTALGKTKKPRQPSN